MAPGPTTGQQQGPPVEEEGKVVVESASSNSESSTMHAPLKFSLSQHAQAAIGVFALSFANSYVTSPSVVGYLAGHKWAGDIVSSLLMAYHVARTYKE
jgi:hypothetical protein